MKALQPKPHSSISWPDVYFAAEANRERFEDVNIITFKSYLAERAYDQAIQEVGIHNEPKLRQRVQAILNSRSIQAMEHVEVRKDRIRVVVDCEQVNDDAMWTALDMVASALDELDGRLGTIHFGSWKTYTATEISWLNVH